MVWSALPAFPRVSAVLPCRLRRIKKIAAIPIANAAITHPMIMPAMAPVEICAGELLLATLAVSDVVEKVDSEVDAASRSVDCQYIWIIGAQTIKELIVD